MNTCMYSRVPGLPSRRLRDSGARSREKLRIRAAATLDQDGFSHDLIAGRRGPSVLALQQGQVGAASSKI